MINLTVAPELEDQTYIEAGVFSIYPHHELENISRVRLDDRYIDVPNDLLRKIVEDGINGK